MVIIVWSIFVALVILMFILVFIDIRRNRRLRKREAWYNNANRLAAFNGKYHIYKTKDGRAYFIFRIVNIGSYINRYEIDILSQPSYLFHNESWGVTHRLPSSRPDCQYKICVRYGFEPKSEDQAKRLAADWAELTWRFIKTGTTIDNQLKRRS